MDMEDTWSSSSSPSPSPPSSPSGGVQQLPAKRKAGRKKFRETRHPVYRGVRARAGGNRWVCEVREPGKPTRIWLGTYPTPEMAARAHDVAAIALRGARAAALNFADSPAALPRAPTSSPGDIRRAAARAAELYGPSASLSIHAPSFTPSPSPPVTHETAAYVDEDAIFDLPALMEDMARGMLLTPPAMRRGVDWDDEGGNERGHMDCTLWMD